MQRKGTGQHDLPWGPCCQPTGPCLCQQPGGRGLRGRLCLQPSSQRSHLPSPGHVHDRWPQVTPSLPRACTVVTAHTFPPQGVHSGHRSHVSPGRLHAEWLPAGQEGSRACPVPPPPRVRPRSRCNGQAVEQPEIHRAALWPALLSADLCPLSRLVHTSDPMALTSPQGELTFFKFLYSCFLFWKTQTPSEWSSGGSDSLFPLEVEDTYCRVLEVLSSRQQPAFPECLCSCQPKTTCSPTPPMVL